MTDTPPTADGQVRPLAAVLQDLKRGEVLDEAAAELQALVRAVRATGKKGKLTLSVEVAPTKGGDALTVSASVKSAPPAAAPPVALFFADKADNLVRDDPRQAALPGLRIAPGNTTDTVKDIAQ